MRGETEGAEGTKVTDETEAFLRCMERNFLFTIAKKMRCLM